MSRKEFWFSVIFGMAVLLFLGCGTSNKAVVNPAVNGGPAFDFTSRTVTLNNGIKMPILGIGTYRLTPEEDEESVYLALTDGYRLIDTANVYMNERAVGRGIQRSGVPREEIFVTTKLLPSDYENVDKAIDDTLARLNLEYIDLLLLHQSFGNYVEGYKGLEKAVADGKVRSIGVCNIYEERFDEIIKIATIPPAILQNETNPFVQQSEMREHVRPYGTILMSWFPLGGRVDNFNNTQTRLFNNETIVEIAEAHGKTPAQVILRWHLQSGNIAIPGSRSADHILENISIFDFELSAAEMQKMSALDTGILSLDFRNNIDEISNFLSPNVPMDFNAQE
ncbi:MAG: aldo/keto reductase [Spirochaetaceae bacterium]|jgi:diketogulonate reductase-like aldo/keto reductase|nr:aldo/keto reductase [Spirochaetaceae bacterium]